MSIPQMNFPKEKALELSKFREMDYYAVQNYHLPIQLMMENAGLQLANMAAGIVDKDQSILIGVGNGNNGGGGLVAARRLAGWGYDVYLHFFTKIDKDLPKKQLERALKFGAKEAFIDEPDLWIDAYLGFSQRLPLNTKLTELLKKANKSQAKKLSLDIPTGFLGDVDKIHFHADTILTLAAPKKILYNLHHNTKLYVADLGIPTEVYAQFNIDILPFNKSNIIQLKR